MMYSPNTVSYTHLDVYKRQDQRCIQCYTGYGLEGDLPDAICKRIQTRDMIPYLKDGTIGFRPSFCFFFTFIRSSTNPTKPNIRAITTADMEFP